MKIYTNNADAIRKRKAEYDAEYDRRKNEYNTQLRAFRQAENDAIESIVDYIQTLLLHTALDVDVRVYRCAEIDNAYDVNIKYGDVGDTDIVWKYSITIDADSGEVIQDDSSMWSSSNATIRSKSYLKELRSSIESIELLNRIDYKNLLSVQYPNRKDYIASDMETRRDFTKDLILAEIDDAIESNQFIKGYGYRTDGYNAYYAVLGKTSKSYMVQEFWIHHNKWSNPYRIRKDKFIQDVLKNHVEIVDPEDIRKDK